MQLLRANQVQLGQHPAVDPVAFGVLLVKTTQVGHLLAVDQVDRHLLPQQVDRHRQPGQPGRLHHHHQRQVGPFAFARPGQQPGQLLGPTVHRQNRRQKLAPLVHHHRFVRAGDRQV